MVGAIAAGEALGRLAEGVPITDERSDEGVDVFSGEIDLARSAKCKHQQRRGKE